MSPTEDILTAAERIKADGKSAPRRGRHPVNQPMIDHWLDAIGDRKSDLCGRVGGQGGRTSRSRRAAGHDQVWTMTGLGGVRPDDDPLGRILGLFDRPATSVWSPRTASRPITVTCVRGEVSVTAELTDVVSPKQPRWVRVLHHPEDPWRVGGEGRRRHDVANHEVPAARRVGTVRAGGSADLEPDLMIRPAVSKDTRFSGTVSTRTSCASRKRPDGSLQHPPVPALWKDKDAPTDYVVASGRGSVFSYVVHHAPKIPGRGVPFVIALVELDEGCGCWASCAMWNRRR